MSRKLLEATVVREWPDPADERRRLLSLSAKGTTLMRQLAPVCTAITAAVAEIDATLPLSDALTKVDQALSQRAFERRYAPDIRRLNLEWLQKHFTVEPIDRVVPARCSRPGRTDMNCPKWR